MMMLTGEPDAAVTETPMNTTSVNRYQANHNGWDQV